MSGTCSHPDCGWTDLSQNWKKHKEGRGKGADFKPGKHPHCDCCKFVPPSSVQQTPALSSLQQTLALLPAFSAVQMHEHMRGEFCRRAAIPAREEMFEKTVADAAILQRHKRFCKETPAQNAIIKMQSNQFFELASKQFDFLQTNQQHVLAHVMIDDRGQVSSKSKFKFVADKAGKYKTTIASFVQ